MSIMGINNSQLMKNFINESLSFIKSTEDSQGNINNVPKKKSKEKNIISYLPEVNKKNSNNNINNNNGYIYNEQHSQRSFQSSSKQLHWHPCSDKNNMYPGKDTLRSSPPVCRISSKYPDSMPPG